MDEPFSALDPLIRMKLQDKLLELQEKLERTIIFVSHDLDEAFKLDNRIVIMEGGRIEQCDTPNGIANNPVSDYVEEFVVHRNPNTFLRAKDTMTSAKIGDGLHVDENTPCHGICRGTHRHPRIRHSNIGLAAKKIGHLIAKLSVTNR